MTLGELLRNSRGAIVGRWLDDILATYSKDFGRTFTNQKNPFANPVGHSLRLGTAAIFEALVEGVGRKEVDVEKIRGGLREIVKIRAIQQFSASDAVAFVFQLRETIRAELASAVGDPRYRSDLASLDRRIDQIALAAFDIFVQCREQVYELRINEVKRDVSWVMKKMNERRVDPASAGATCDRETSEGVHVRGEVLR